MASVNNLSKKSRVGNWRPQSMDDFKRGMAGIIAFVVLTGGVLFIYIYLIKP